MRLVRLFRQRNIIYAIFVLALCFMLFSAGVVVSGRVRFNENVVIERGVSDGIGYTGIGSFNEINTPERAYRDVTESITVTEYDGSPIELYAPEECEFILQYIPSTYISTGINDKCMSTHLPGAGALRLLRKEPIEQSGNVCYTQTALLLDCGAIYSLQWNSMGTKFAVAGANGVYIVDVTVPSVKIMKLPDNLSGIITGCWWGEDEQLLYLDMEDVGCVCICDASTGYPIDMSYNKSYPYVKYTNSFTTVIATRHDSNGESIRLIGDNSAYVMGMLRWAFGEKLIISTSNNAVNKLLLWDTDENSVSYFYPPYDVIDVAYSNRRSTVYYTYYGENGYTLRAVSEDGDFTQELTGLPGGDFMQCADGDLLFFGFDGLYCKVGLAENGSIAAVESSCGETGDVYSILCCIAEAKRIADSEDGKLNSAFADSVTRATFYSSYGHTEAEYPANFVRQSALSLLQLGEFTVADIMPESLNITGVYIKDDRATVVFASTVNGTLELCRVGYGFRITGVCTEPYSFMRTKAETTAYEFNECILNGKNFYGVPSQNVDAVCRDVSDMEEELGVNAVFTVSDVCFANSDVGKLTDGVIPIDTAYVYIAYNCAGRALRYRLQLTLNRNGMWEVDGIKQLF